MVSVSLETDDGLSRELTQLAKSSWVVPRRISDWMIPFFQNFHYLVWYFHLFSSGTGSVCWKQSHTYRLSWHSSLHLLLLLLQLFPSLIPTVFSK